MIEVVPLKYGPMFKQAFSDPEIFSSFVADVLGITIKVDQVRTEYEYPKPVGFVRSRYDLFAEDREKRLVVEIQQLKEDDFFDRFLYYHIISMAEQVGGYREYEFERTVYTIVVLTSVPQDGSVNFSCAISDFSPIDEFGRHVPIYGHRLVFLVPRLANEHTPPNIRRWLDFIADSLDGKMEESKYIDYPSHQRLLRQIRTETITPDTLAKIKDEAAWEKTKARLKREGLVEGKEEGKAEGLIKGKAEGLIEGKASLLSTMLARGVNITQIAAWTGLTEEEINRYAATAKTQDKA